MHGDSATLCLNETANERGYVFDYNDEGDYFNKLIDSAKNVVSHFVASSQLYSLLLGMRYGETTKIENAEIMQIVRYISDNLNGDLSVQNLASIVNLSRPYFTELFTKTIGKSPYVYVTEERLKKARQLLYTTNKSMGEIATLCGYYDVSSFIRLFKKREGVTPLEFRKNNPL